MRFGAARLEAALQLSLEPALHYHSVVHRQLASSASQVLRGLVARVRGR